MTPATIHHVRFLQRLPHPLFMSCVQADRWPEVQLALDLRHVPYLAADVAGRGWYVVTSSPQVSVFTREMGWQVEPSGLNAVLLADAVRGVVLSEQWSADCARQADRAPTCGRELTGGLCP